MGSGKTMTKITQSIKRGFDGHKLMRRIVVFLVTIIAGFATWMVYGNLALANAAVASIYATTIGLMGTIVGFYMKHRNEEETSKTENTDDRTESESE